MTRSWKETEQNKNRRPVFLFPWRPNFKVRLLAPLWTRKPSPQGKRQHLRSQHPIQLPQLQIEAKTTGRTSAGRGETAVTMKCLYWPNGLQGVQPYSGSNLWGVVMPAL